MDIILKFDDEILPAIERALLAVGNFRPAMSELADLMETSARRRFDEGRAPDGAAWKPSERAVRDGGKTLIDTSQLVSSLTRDFDDHSAVAGTNVIYAAFHQYGAKRATTVRAHSRKVDKLFGKKLRQTTSLSIPSHTRTANLAARAFLGFSDEDSKQIHDIIGLHLRNAFAGE